MAVSMMVEDLQDLKRGLSEVVFVRDDKIPLKDFADPILADCMAVTTNLEPLATELLSKSILTRADCIYLKSQPDEHSKLYFLYDVVYKKVDAKSEYERLFAAFDKTGNIKIAQKIFTQLKNHKSNTSASLTPGISTQSSSHALLSQDTLINSHEMMPLKSAGSEVNEDDLNKQDIKTHDNPAAQQCSPLLNNPWKAVVVALAVVGLIVSVGFNIKSAIFEGAQVCSTLPVPPQSPTPVEVDSHRYLTSHKREDFGERNSVAENTVFNTVVSTPSELKALTTLGNIHMPNNNSTSDNLLHADKMIVLTSYKTFTLPKIRDFLFKVNKATTLCIYNLHETLCSTNFRDNPNNIRLLTIGDPPPKDLPHTETHLTISIHVSYPWVSWFPRNVDKVKLLRLSGEFSPLDLQHFLSIMNNLAVLCIDKVVERLCDEEFEEIM